MVAVYGNFFDFFDFQKPFFFFFKRHQRNIIFSYTPPAPSNTHTHTQNYRRHFNECPKFNRLNLILTLKKKKKSGKSENDEFINIIVTHVPIIIKTTDTPAFITHRILIQ